MNSISYSLFGYSNDQKSGFAFRAFLRNLTLVIRMNHLLYPGWENFLALDKSTYSSEFKEIFDHLKNTGWLKLNIHEQTDPLCKSMLWRLEPIWMGSEWTICRDLDSLPIYKEAAAVQVWMENNTKAVHVMTHSDSHNVTIMGGMCGFKWDWFQDRMRPHGESFEKLLRLGKDIDFSVKGTDQDFLNRHILPRVSDSMCEHYFLGMPQSFRSMCFVGQHIVDNVVVKNIPQELKESNYLVNHIGQAGFAVDNVVKFLYAHSGMENEITEIEKKFKHIYYWEA